MLQLSRRFSATVRARPLSTQATIAIGLVGVAMAVALIRAPSALTHFDRRASFNAQRTPIERTIAAADGVGIDNAFVEEALALIPKNAPYAFEEPQSADIAAKDYDISGTTYLALPGYVQYLLLPR